MAERLATRFAREREELREKVEKKAARQVREREKQAEARAKVQAREAKWSSWRTGLGFGGAAALGVMLLAGQMIAIGALVLGATGAGALGLRYLRHRREAAAAVEVLPPEGKRKKLIEA
jgi:hypothetical protein